MDLKMIDLHLDEAEVIETEAVESDSMMANIDEIDFSADIELLEKEEVQSVLESALFVLDKPQSPSALLNLFEVGSVELSFLKECLDDLVSYYDSPLRGLQLQEVGGGYQLRTKKHNRDFLQRLKKHKPFRLSGPALEVLSILAYRQPLIKSQVDEIRGVESGHLVRALMDRGFVAFSGKSELPGKPMLYKTTKKFLEIFGLKNLNDLPTWEEIKVLFPEGMIKEEAKASLSDLSGHLAEDEESGAYSMDEEDHVNIQDEIKAISTSSDFFEQEKQREKDRQNEERAESLKEALLVGEPVSTRDQNWLERYEATKLEALEAEAIEQEILEDNDGALIMESEEDHESFEATEDLEEPEIDQADQLEE